MMRVVVLMSTYQGAPFVAAQLQSILSQLPEDGRIFIRDDGSTDDTIVAIDAMHESRISVIRGENVGFARSFLALLDAAPLDADMYMLADQDDYWLPYKVSRAWSGLQSIPSDVPGLYCSRLRLADAQLNPTGLSPVPPRSPSFASALTENIVTGCTAAFNPAALRLARHHGNISRIYFHDWWIYLVVAAFGTVLFDPEPTALYRQHYGNAIGMGSGFGRYVRIVRFLGRANFVHIMFDQIENLLDVFAADLNAEQLSLINRYFNPRDPRSIRRLVFAPRRHRQRLLDDILLRGMIVLSIFTRRGLLPRQA